MKKHFIPTRLGLYTQKIVQPVFKSRGLMEGRILTHWSQIVGEKLAALALPEKITFARGAREGGTLHLSVTSSGAMFLQYAQDLILEQVNTFFGYKAVSKVRMTHGLIPVAAGGSPAPPEKPLSTEKKEALEAHTQAVVDPELKELLQRLGRGIV